MSVDLRYILATVVDDPTFLQVTEQMILSDTMYPPGENCGMTIVDDVSRTYTLLPAGSVVTCENSLIPMAQGIIPESHIRRGVQSDLADLPSASLLATVALLFRPELRDLNQAELIPELKLLSEFLRTSISNNAQIDPVRNTSGLQRQHATINDQLASSNITGDLLQRIANIMEVNILVSYLDTRMCVFYWACGKEHNRLNICRDLWCISCVDNRCEPILCRCADPRACMLQCYSRILDHPTLESWIPISLEFPEICRMMSNGPHGLEGIGCLKYYRAPEPISSQTLIKTHREIEELLRH